MLLLEELLTILERYDSSGWYILPATMELYNRRTVDIIKAASEWGDAVIYVCKNDQNRTCFVSSSGDLGYKVGSRHRAYHDQTRASKGTYEIINIVTIKNGEIVDKKNDLGINEKASLAVFK